MLAQLDQDSNLSWLFSPCWMKWMYIDDVGRWVTSCCGNGESSLTSVWILRNLRRAGGTLGKNRVFWSNWEISFKSQIIWTPPLDGFKEKSLNYNIIFNVQFTWAQDNQDIIYFFINQQKWSKNGSLQTIRSHLSNSAAQIFPPLAVAISKTCAVSPLSSSGTLHSSRCWPQKRMETPGPNLRNGWVLQNGIKSIEVTCFFGKQIYNFYCNRTSFHCVELKR